LRHLLNWPLILLVIFFLLKPKNVNMFIFFFVVFFGLLLLLFFFCLSLPRKCGCFSLFIFFLFWFPSRLRNFLCVSEKQMWVAVTPTAGVPPPPLSFHTATALDNGRAVLVAGGVDSSAAVHDGLYVLDMATRTWRQLPEKDKRCNHAAVLLVETKNVKRVVARKLLDE
jgi:hypothetical protein